MPGAPPDGVGAGDGVSKHQSCAPAGLTLPDRSSHVLSGSQHFTTLFPLLQLSQGFAPLTWLSVALLCVTQIGIIYNAGDLRPVPGGAMGSLGG